MLEKLARAWADFEASYAGLSNEELMIPNVTGKWSVRDIIAHVTWWDEEALKHLPVILRAAARSATPTTTAASMISTRS